MNFSMKRLRTSSTLEFLAAVLRRRLSTSADRAKQRWHIGLTEVSIPHTDELQPMTEEKTQRESDIEADIVDFAEMRGWWQTKFISPSLRGVTDRLFLRRGRVIFLEVKRPGEEPTPQQQKRMRDIRSHGGEVYWVDSLEKARAILR